MQNKIIAPKRITVAAAIILNEQHQILLVRKKGTPFFMHVGGKLEAQESPQHALIRETMEEIGITPKILTYIGQYETATANEPDHLLMSYLYQVQLDSAPRIQAELAEMKWMDLDDTETLLAPLVREVSIPWCKALLEKTSSTR